MGIPRWDILTEEMWAFLIEEYEERRRGMLWKYLMENREGLVEETSATERHRRNVNKILWWNQKKVKFDDEGERDYFWIT